MPSGNPEQVNAACPDETMAEEQVVLEARPKHSPVLLYRGTKVSLSEQSFRTFVSLTSDKGELQTCRSYTQFTGAQNDRGCISIKVSLDRKILFSI